MTEPAKFTDEQIDFMRADLDSGMAFSKIVDACKEMMKADGRDFDVEFDKWKKANGRDFDVEFDKWKKKQQNVT